MELILLLSNISKYLDMHLLIVLLGLWEMICYLLGKMGSYTLMV